MLSPSLFCISQSVAAEVLRFSQPGESHSALVPILLGMERWEDYGVGLNVPALAAIFHVHIHLIPRYLNDVPDPRGGVRGVVQESN